MVDRTMRYRWIVVLFALLLPTLACNLPTMPATGMIVTGTPDPAGTGTALINPTPSAPGTVTGTPAGSIPGTSGNSACTYKASFVEDVTIPDDTVMAPGAAFTKTWRVKNDGTCTWGPDGYALHAIALTSGDALGAQSPVPLPAVVQPGQTVDISVNMVAPNEPGTYTSAWKFRIDNDANGAGPFIGLDPDGQGPLFVRIVVRSGA